MIKYKGSHGFDDETVQPYDDPEFEQGHAFGYLINPYHSRVLVLDVDTYDKEVIEFIKTSLLEQEHVRDLDVAISSFAEDGTPKGRHIYAGLDDYYNLLPLYSLGIEGTCKGFNDLIVKKGEIVIRCSPKFFMRNVSRKTIIRWEEGYSKVGGNRCLKFTQELLTAPLITVDAQSYVEPEKAHSRTLRLRG